MQTRLRLTDGWVDLERGQVERDEPVSLTAREVRLLAYLASRPAAPCPTEELLQEVWGYNARVRSRAVDAAVHRLRRKLEVDPRKPAHLVTVYGKGVYFRPAEAAERTVEADFVGREEVLEQVLSWLDAGRSVQVTGSGGMGKTRLAREVLARREGVFCSLAQATDVEGAGRALAWTLGVEPGVLGTDEGTFALAEAMAARGVVVLDNAEWVEGLGPWLDALGSEATVLVTTRRRLEAQLEALPLAPLETGAGVALLRSLTGLASSPELESVVERVGGLPLALRLVHRHLSWLSPAEVAERAQRLVSEAADAGPHGSLEVVVRTSLEHLDPDVRDGMVRLGAFPLAPWPVDAAAAVVGSLEGLRALVDASLLERQPDMGVLELHPLVHGQLAPDGEAICDAHRRLQGWFEPWSGPLLREEASPQQLEVLFALAPLLAGVHDPIPALRYGAGLAAYERGELRAAEELVAGVVAHDTLVDARLQLLRCQIDRRLGRAVAASETLSAVLEEADWPPGVLSAGWQLVAVAWTSVGQHARALEAFRRAEEGAGARTPVERAMLRLDRCKSEAGAGQLAEAYVRAQQAWSELEGAPSTYVVNGLNTLGTLALRLGRMGTARGWFELALSHAQDDPQRSAVVHGNLAALELTRGASESAIRHVDAALRGHRRSGRRRGMAMARVNRGRALLLSSQWQLAAAELEQARALLVALGMAQQVRWTGAFLAIAWAELGELGDARAELDDAALDDDVGQIAAAWVARAAGEDATMPDAASVSPELRAHVEAFTA